MALSEKQKRRIAELKRYIAEVKTVQKTDFDKWFEGKKEICENIGAYLLLIEEE